MTRLLRPDGAIFFSHKWRVQGGLLQDRPDIADGLPVRQTLIWERAGGIDLNPGYFRPNYEDIQLLADIRMPGGKSEACHAFRPGCNHFIG